ncbi:hypothetical protein F2Q69_00063024 [Brassica cretica]|uniref:Uncharacterized protein n=1 Tax=Brassica cretica TaxID=69181 RepID=A0A8S9RIK9_BRACR|nr:hypothetical protein F2Q69_00063024 [Brassica cretica]
MSLSRSLSVVLFGSLSVVLCLSLSRWFSVSLSQWVSSRQRSSPSVALLRDVSFGVSYRRRLSLSLSLFLCGSLSLSPGGSPLKFVGTLRIRLSVGHLLEAFHRWLTSNRKF